jgi:hypothetical protein
LTSYECPCKCCHGAKQHIWHNKKLNCDNTSMIHISNGQWS